MESLTKLHRDVKKFRARLSVSITNYTLISSIRFESRRKKGNYYPSYQGGCHGLKYSDLIEVLSS